MGKRVRGQKWADKSTTYYDILDFKSYVKSLAHKYLVIESPRHTFAIFIV